MTIGQRIKQRREELGLSQEELSHMLGYKNRSSINKIELGLQQLRQSKLIAIANALQTSVLWILGAEEEDIKENVDNVNFNYDNIYPLQTKRVPLVGAIACGEPMWVDEQYGEYVIVNGDVAADFALRCQGDSMIGARIYDGDIVFIRKQPQVENGEIAAVVIDETATLKRVYRYDDYLSLNAENPAYPPIILREGDAEEIRILGKAIAFQSFIR